MPSARGGGFVECLLRGRGKKMVGCPVPREFGRVGKAKGFGHFDLGSEKLFEKGELGSAGCCCAELGKGEGLHGVKFVARVKVQMFD